MIQIMKKHRRKSQRRRSRKNLNENCAKNNIHEIKFVLNLLIFKYLIFRKMSGDIREEDISALIAVTGQTR